MAADGGYEQRGGAWVHPGARIGGSVTLEPGAVIGDAVSLGAGCWVGAGAVIYGPAELGEKNRIFPGAVLGGEPQDIGYGGEPTRLVAGDRNVFREGVTVHRGTVKGGGLTRIGSDNYFMAGSHIGHDCVVEDHVVLANDVLIAGHCHLQSNVNMAGAVAIVQFTTVGRHAFIGGLSGTTMDVEPFLSHDGLPARPMGVNLIGLRRGNFPHRTINALKEAYRTIFTSSAKGGDSLESIRKELEARGVLCAEVEELLDFMTRSRAGRYGRMLQLRTPGENEEPPADRRPG